MNLDTLLKQNHTAFKTSNSKKLTTGSYAVRFGILLGYAKIVLLGIDCHYVEKIKGSTQIDQLKLKIVKSPGQNPNYFFDDYQRPGDLYQLPNPSVHGGNLHLQTFQVLSIDLKTYGIKTRIINCNKHSELYKHRVFPYQDISDII